MFLAMAPRLNKFKNVINRAGKVRKGRRNPNKPFCIYKCRFIYLFSPFHLEIKSRDASWCTITHPVARRKPGASILVIHSHIRLAHQRAGAIASNAPALFFRHWIRAWITLPDRLDSLKVAGGWPSEILFFNASSLSSFFPLPGPGSKFLTGFTGNSGSIRNINHSKRRHTPFPGYIWGLTGLNYLDYRLFYN